MPVVTKGRSRRRLLGWAAALATVLVASGTVVLLLRRPAPPAKGADAPAAQRFPRKAGAKLLPLPKSPRAPSIPRWAVDGEVNRAKTEEVTDHKTLPNGVEAKMFGGKSSYPASAPVDVHLELLTPEGEPLAGRADLSLVAFDSFNGAAEPINLNFAERVDEPGVYDASIQAPKTWQRVTVLLTLNERGSPGDPGENELLQLQVDHSAPAHLLSATDAKLSEKGAEVVIGVVTDRAGRAAVRAELRDGEGQSFGDAFGVSYLAPGQGRVTLVFPALHAAHASASHAFYLADLTLFIDETTADFRAEPLPINFKSAAALAQK